MAGEQFKTTFIRRSWFFSSVGAGTHNVGGRQRQASHAGQCRPGTSGQARDAWKSSI